MSAGRLARTLISALVAREYGSTKNLDADPAANQHFGPLPKNHLSGWQLRRADCASAFDATESVVIARVFPEEAWKRSELRYFAVRMEYSLYEAPKRSTSGGRETREPV
jgi:hypothetical protein